MPIKEREPVQYKVTIIHDFETDEEATEAYRNRIAQLMPMFRRYGSVRKLTDEEYEEYIKKRGRE